MAAHTQQTRTRPMRLTLASLLVIPLVSLLALWVFAASQTLGNALRERDYNAIITKSLQPTSALAGQLSQERLASYIWLSAGRLTPVTVLVATRHRTDAAVAAYRRVVAATKPLNTAAVRQAQDTLLADLDTLPTIRLGVDTGGMTPADAFVAYSKIVDAEFGVYSAGQVNDVSVYRQTHASIEAARAEELVGREAALVAGAAVARGQMNTSERALFATAVADQRLLINDALAQFSQPMNGLWARLYNSPAHQRFAGLEDQIAASVGGKARIPVNIRTWQAVSGAFLADMQATVAKQGPPLAQLTRQLGNKLLLEAILAGGVGLLAVVASILLTMRYGRRLTRELTGLHDSAESMASQRLPGVVERLRRGEEVDVDAESPPPAPGKITEVAKVAQAFAAVQRTAVEAAVGQANLRKGVNQVFLNISLRNQSLLHRQLGMLDAMERATSDPAALADLFRLDHLTTRMRRHAEGLIILSGATPGRRWRDPVPVVDVLRAAVAEVEDYIRVEVVSESRDSVIGTAVNDVIHLVAELVENATAFSPPTTHVEIRADNVSNGFAVEIEDRGLGLTADEMAEINERLANPPEFDLANSEQLGLFVVGQLAARHGIKVSLSGSAYGGIRAIVLLPPSVMARGTETDKQAGLSSGGQPPVWEVAAGPSPREAAGTAADWERAPVLSRRHRLAPEGPPGGLPASAPPDAAVHGERGIGSRAAGAQPAVAGTHLGLPVRVRQANLAPQLRVGPDLDPGSGSAVTDLPGARSPEQTRSLMTSLQDGWRHGRTDDLDHPAGGPGDRSGGTPGAATDSSDGEAT